MKLNKILFSLLLITGIIFCSVVNADSISSFTLNSNGQVNGSGEILRGSSSDLPAYFTYKYANVGGTNYIVLCTGSRKATATSGTTYTKSNSWDGAVRAGIAAIISNGIGSDATISTTSNNSDKLYFTQIALWKYIQKEIGTDEELTYTLGSCSTAQTSKINELYNAGENAKSRYNTINNFAITLDATKLNFTLNGDTYESQVIKLSGNEIKSKTATVNKGTVVEKDGGYVIRIAKSALSSGKNTITFKVDAQSNSILVASNYSNGKSSEQTTTIALFDTFSKTNSKSITGNITIGTNKVIISKQDITTGKELPGAELVLKNSKGETIESWISETTPYEIEKTLEAGEYTLTETNAPDGYEKSSETITFKVNENGEIEQDVIMYNKPKEVEKSVQTGISNTMMFSLIVAFVSFAIAFYYFADYKVKNKM